jgi:hypothetical protein
LAWMSLPHPLTLRGGGVAERGDRQIQAAQQPQLFAAMRVA